MCRLIIIFISILIFSVSNLTGQSMFKPSDYEILRSPEWVKEMYSESPNFYKVQSLYNKYYEENNFEKNYNTQYYKRWKRLIMPYVRPDGSFRLPDLRERKLNIAAQINKMNSVEARSPKWSLLGPVLVLNNDGKPGNDQTNVYSVNQSRLHDGILYCGTEPGEVYRSDDKGLTWKNISLHNDFGGGINAVTSFQDNDSIVLVGGGLGIFRSKDGGTTWQHTLPLNYKNIAEIMTHPSISGRVFACTDDGLFMSVDQGASWTQIFKEKCYDIKCNPSNDSIIYLVKNNPDKRICEFFLSKDGGLTWEDQTTGWFESSDEARNDGGARIAVTEANPKDVFVYLIGEAKAGDLGFIGVYKSMDTGKSWQCITGIPGGPYDDNHPNLAIGWPGWDYHQGFYNCAIMVNNQDTNQILIGGLNLWRSVDGGITWKPHAGYRGGPLNMHVDVQDMRSYGSDYYISTDGGIYHSSDFFETQPQFVMRGIHGSDYWGFGSGWNEDVLVGGLYHNGNLANYEKYNPGDFLSLGGGEAPTGYINPGNNRKAYFSDIGGKIIPINITDPISSFSIGKAPNESYWSAASSEMEFDPSCYNTAYLGNENKLWKTTDGGSNFSVINEFGTYNKNNINYIEICRKNPKVIYCTQQMEDGSNGILWKTIDGGLSWTPLNTPPGYSHRMLITLDPLNENKLWLAYPSSQNGQKIYKTEDGGINWINLSSDILNNQESHCILNIAGTKGGIYYLTNTTIYYRNDEMNDWKISADGLPYFFNSNIAHPFYRDKKIRVAAYGKGIWEAPLEEAPDTIIQQLIVDKLSVSHICNIDTFYFDDYSIAAHDGLTWKWEFEGGNPSTSDERNPNVVFENEGSHKVKMILTDKNGKEYIDTLTVNVEYYHPVGDLSEGFEAGVFNKGWYFASQPSGGNWTIADVGGFGSSDYSTVFRNFDYDALGSWSDIRVKTEIGKNTHSILTFDVAYAEYGYPYTDSLEVLFSTDCGVTFSSLYFEGGQDLATHSNSDHTFIPEETDWRTDSIELPQFDENTDLVIAFRNHGHWGNNIYLDNININGKSLKTDEINDNQIIIYPNPIKSGTSLTLKSISQFNEVNIFNLEGKKVISEKITSGQKTIKIPVDLIPNNYLINLKGNNRIANRKLTVW